MATFSLTALTLCVWGGVSVHLAPDQPLPVVYMDDPLVMEFVADASGAYEVDVTVSVAGHAPEILTLDTLNLEADTPYWKIVSGLTKRRGWHRVETTVRGSAGDSTSSGGFHRIDRAVGVTDSRMEITFTDGDVLPGRAAMEIPHERVGWSGSAEGLEGFVAAYGGRRADLFAYVADGEGLAETVALWRDGIASWRMDSNADAAVYAAMGRIIQSGDPVAPMRAEVADANVLGALIRSGVTSELEGISIPYDWERRDSVDVLRGMAERSGVEGMDISLRLPEKMDERDLARALVFALTRDTDGITLPMGALADADGALSPAFSQVSWLSGISGRVRYVGALDLPDGNSGQVFRFRDEKRPRNWSVALWSAAEKDALSMGVGDAASVVLQDSLGNYVRAFSPVSDEVTITSDAALRWLAGEGGSVLAQAACNAVKAEATALTGVEPYMAILPESVRQRVTELQACDPSRSKRLEFFTLLRAFPALEAGMHKGGIPDSVGVPVCAALSRMAMALAVLEHETGTPFLEPISKTRATAAEFQSTYRTRTATAEGADDRAGWLLGEVSRLLTVSGELESEGRNIEASAVASLAEWRARSLEAFFR